MSVDFSRFKAPFIPAPEIHRQADDFRSTYWKGPPPIDVLAIAEHDLDFEIRPVHSLKSRWDADAFLMGKKKVLIVDHDQFMDDRFQNRLRFSVAHEIGHWVLHQDLIVASFDSIDEWHELIAQIPDDQYSFIEYHANEFAGRLLAPPELLGQLLREALEKARKSGLSHEIIHSGAALEYIASDLAKKLAASKDVVEKRLIKEQLWPPNTDE